MTDEERSELGKAVQAVIAELDKEHAAVLLLGFREAAVLLSESRAENVALHKENLDLSQRLSVFTKDCVYWEQRANEYWLELNGVIADYDSAVALLSRPKPRKWWQRALGA